MSVFFGQELYFHTRLSCKKLAGENAEALKSQVDSRDTVFVEGMCSSPDDPEPSQLCDTHPPALATPQDHPQAPESGIGSSPTCLGKAFSPWWDFFSCPQVILPPCTGGKASQVQLNGKKHLPFLSCHLYQCQIHTKVLGKPSHLLLAPSCFGRQGGRGIGGDGYARRGVGTLRLGACVGRGVHVHVHVCVPQLVMYMCGTCGFVHLAGIHTCEHSTLWGAES